MDEDVDVATNSDPLHGHRAQIRSFLAARAGALRILSVDDNPFSRQGTPLFERFVAAWSASKDATVQCVFHGTAEANVSSSAFLLLLSGMRASWLTLALLFPVDARPCSLRTRAGSITPQNAGPWCVCLSM